MTRDNIIQIITIAAYGWACWCAVMVLWLTWLVFPPIRKLIGAGIILLVVAIVTRKVEIKMIEQKQV